MSRWGCVHTADIPDSQRDYARGVISRASSDFRTCSARGGAIIIATLNYKFSWEGETHAKVSGRGFGRGVSVHFSERPRGSGGGARWRKRGGKDHRRVHRR